MQRNSVVQKPCKSAGLHSRAEVCIAQSKAGFPSGEPSGLVAKVRLVRDFRSERMESPEGLGIARRAWQGYVDAVGRVTTPALRPLVRKYAAGSIVDLVGFWAVWHLEGGFEGLLRMGMSRASIYRRIKLFRIAFGAHPDEFEMPGITLDLVAFREGWAEKKAKAKSQS